MEFHGIRSKTDACFFTLNSEVESTAKTVCLFVKSMFYALFYVIFMLGKQEIIILQVKYYDNVALQASTL